MTRKLLLPVLAVLSAVAATLPAVSLPSSAAAAGPVRVVRRVDGDTVVTNRGTVRLVGVDTPERGKCGYGAATRAAARMAPHGSVIRLGNPASVSDKDRYGRLLRYVNRGRTDVGARQIVRGAWARYDSRDGYQHHPRQDRYRSLDAHHRNYCGTRNPSTGSSSGGSTGGPRVGPRVAGWRVAPRAASRVAVRRVALSVESVVRSHPLGSRARLQLRSRGTPPR